MDLLLSVIVAAFAVNALVWAVYLLQYYLDL